MKFITATTIHDRRGYPTYGCTAQISGPYEAPENTVSHSEEFKSFDRYIDVFNTKEEAEAFIRESRKI